jgi:cytochrome c-type biogenesis protein CcmE
MTTKRKQRLAVVILIMLGTGIATALALTAFRENMLFFFDPSQIVAGDVPLDRQIRVGGMVEDGSIQREADSLRIAFSITDFQHSVLVKYEGILPDLFREGQGVIAIGKMQADGLFKASQILARHDENYMPPEVARSLKEQHAPLDSSI